MKSPTRNRNKSPFGGVRRDGDRTVSRPILIGGGLVCFFIVIQLIWPRAFGYLFMGVFGPVWSSSASVAADLTPRSELVAENAQLQQELAAEEALASSTAALAQENTQLKALLGRSGSSPEILAAVLKRPPGAGYDFLLLDVGTADGIAQGDRVYAPGDLLIGSVVEADAHASKAELYSSPGQSYDVLIGSHQIPAVALGQGGGAFSASVSREAAISVGDAVIVPGISSSAFGDVDAVISEPAQPFAQVLFREPANVYELGWVMVSKGAGMPGAAGLGAAAASTTAH